MSLKIKRIKLGVIPSFSLYKLHEKNYINESVVLVIENSTSILLEEIYKDNIDVVIGDITHLKNNSLYTQEIYTEDFIVAYGDENKFKNTNQVSIKSLKMRIFIYKHRHVIHMIFLKIIP